MPHLQDAAELIVAELPWQKESNTCILSEKFAKVNLQATLAKDSSQSLRGAKESGKDFPWIAC
jgi:hypothetical protein